MTNESRRAFEEWNKSEDKHLTHNRLIAWQASEARILALLDSEETLNEVARRSRVENWCFATYPESQEFAKAAIEAIKQRINKGE